MKKIAVGIDPGKDGAIAMVYPSGEVTLEKFPMIGGVSGEYDIPKMLERFEIDNQNIHVVLEDVKALQKPFNSGNWSLSRGKTIIEVALIANKIPFTMVHSKTWQKETMLGVPILKKPNGTKDTKSMALIAAKRIFPEQTFLRTARTTTPDEGYVDAILMAEYCRRKYC